MNGFWYKLLVRGANLCGPWLFTLVSRLIATVFFIFSRRVSESRRFYAALYPEKGRLYHLWCTFNQYQNFTTIHLDRFLAGHATPATFISEGLEKLEEMIGHQGCILLMSHLGNWEMAATLLKMQREDLQLLLYMGVKEKEGVERLQKDDLRRSGVAIIGVDHADNSPFSAVAALRVLRSGGLVSMAGDIVWRNDQRQVRVTFLGHDAYLPEAPFIFALLSGAPIFVFFAFRIGKNKYQVPLSGPLFIQSKCRADRQGAIASAAQQYADLLEKALRQHPFEWYHFDRFIQ
ncbi:MAG: lysophospholipid acyltransferase family protein [Proteobacteria bacterium]|nr:lysophospholipid acyltransferase family protein [Pseudomonadota bacterium]